MKEQHDRARTRPRSLCTHRQVAERCTGPVPHAPAIEMAYVVLMALEITTSHAADTPAFPVRPSARVLPCIHKEDV